MDDKPVLGVTMPEGYTKPVGEISTAKSMLIEDEDCCDVWPRIATTFEWMRYTDQPDMCTMPHIESCYGKGKFFVNFCPSCGKDARNRNMLARRIRKA